MSDNIAERQRHLVRMLKEHGASLVGFGDVSVVGSELTRKHPVAISIGLKYGKKVVENLHIDEASFHDHVMGLNETLKGLLGITGNLLSQWGYRYETVSLDFRVTSNEQLRDANVFAHKTAATCAGLGWIGKCSLLVTPQYGARIKLATVLTNAVFETAQPVVKDRCKGCTLCVKACPYGAIHNVNWERGVERDRLFDPYLCNGKRAEYIPALGRKHSCGLCLQACKIGN